MLTASTPIPLHPRTAPASAASSVDDGVARPAMATPPKPTSLGIIAASPLAHALASTNVSTETSLAGHTSGAATPISGTRSPGPCDATTRPDQLMRTTPSTAHALPAAGEKGAVVEDTIAAAHHEWQQMRYVRRSFDASSGGKRDKRRKSTEQQGPLSRQESLDGSLSVSDSGNKSLASSPSATSPPRPSFMRPKRAAEPAPTTTVSAPPPSSTVRRWRHDPYALAPCWC